MSNEQPQPIQPKPEAAATPPPAPAKPALTPETLHASQQIVQKPLNRANAGGSGAVPSAGESMDRRTFIKWLTIGWAAFAAVLGGYGAMILRFFFPNVLFEPKQSFRAGFPDEYPVNEVSERWKDRHAVWIVRDTEKIYVLSTVCTHLGCTPNWLAGESKFKCPCHGSGFYKTGINFEGPAPRPLERFKISLSDDGEILVDKTKKFQQEKGEWSDPESFLVV